MTTLVAFAVLLNTKDEVVALALFEPADWRSANISYI